MNLTDYFLVVASTKHFTPVKIEYDHIKIRKGSSEQFVVDLEPQLSNIHQSYVSLPSDLVLEDVINAINTVIDFQMPLITLSRKRKALAYKRDSDFYSS